MFVSWARRTAIAAGWAFTVSTAAVAQQKLELTPFLAGFVPLSTLGSVRVPLSGGQPNVVDGQMKTSGAFGGRLSVWVGERWGLEGSYFLSTSDLRITSGVFSRSVDAEMHGGSVKAFFQATNEPTGTDLLVSGGVSGILHRGPAFSLANEQLDLGGVLGGGLHVVMSPLVTFRIDGEIYLYRYAFAPGFASVTQTDLLMTVGLGLKLAR